MRGFSLVELSIVLVILGLLTGGILAGQSLIRAAELRSVPADAQRYTTAMYTFRDKYMALPGDFREATRFWGYQTGTDCTNNTGAANNINGACDGNGDGILSTASLANASAEVFQFWRHLALAGLVEGTFTGISGPANYADTTSGNIMLSRISNTGFHPFPTNFGGTGGGLGTVDTNGWWNKKPVETRNILSFGGYGPNTWVAQPALTPEEAWSIDSKIDDGKPAEGGVISMGCRAYTPNCMVDAAGAVATNDCVSFQAVARYQLTYTGKACALLFKIR